MWIADREIGPGQPALITAEISGNHNGSLDRAVQLIHAAKDAGADAVKFQAFTMDEILGLRGTGQAPPPWEFFTLPELYTKVITPHDWFPDLFAEARRIGIIPFASVFGRESLALLESLDCPAYKIAKAEANSAWMGTVYERAGKPVLVSGRNVLCPSGYPCKISDLQLWRLSNDHYIGLSCHCPDPRVGVWAVAAGTHYLEFHLNLDDGVPTLDDCVNLTASQFREMVSLVRRAEEML